MNMYVQNVKKNFLFIEVSMQMKRMLGVQSVVLLMLRKKSLLLAVVLLEVVLLALVLLEVLAVVEGQHAKQFV
jgi:hypothetical protein